MEHDEPLDVPDNLDALEVGRVGVQAVETRTASTTARTGSPSWTTTIRSGRVCRECSRHAVRFVVVHVVIDGVCDVAVLVAFHPATCLATHPPFPLWGSGEGGEG